MNGWAGYCWRPMMKEIFTNNLMAKLVSLLLAILLWAVIKKTQLGGPTTSLPEPVPTTGANHGK